MLISKFRKLYFIRLRHQALSNRNSISTELIYFLKITKDSYFLGIILMYTIYVSILRELLKRESLSHKICFYNKRKKESPSVLLHAKKKSQT